MHSVTVLFVTICQALVITATTDTTVATCPATSTDHCDAGTAPTTDIKFQSPSVSKLSKMIESDSVINIQFNAMIDEANVSGYDVDSVLSKLDNLLSVSIEFNKTDPNKTITLPILDFMSPFIDTESGNRLMLNYNINFGFWKDYLKEYHSFLSGKSSQYSLNKENGWLCESASKLMKLDDYIIPDINDEYGGFLSWNDFFSRKIKPESRPILEEDYSDESIVISSCDCEALKLDRNLQYEDRFWIKNEPFCISTILNNHEFSKFFINGTGMHFHLCPYDYHRWHSPINGIIKDVVTLDGYYYSVLGDDSITNLTHSIGYMAHMSARTLIFIENDKFGLICFIAVGLQEVSSVIVNDNIKAGHKISKGDELGYFQFGGSAVVYLFNSNLTIQHTVPLQQQYQVKMGQKNCHD